MAEVLRVPMVVRPAAGEDLDSLGWLGGAGDVVERAIGESVEWGG